MSVCKCVSSCMSASVCAQGLLTAQNVIVLLTPCSIKKEEEERQRLIALKEYSLNIDLIQALL